MRTGQERWVNGDHCEKWKWDTGKNILVTMKTNQSHLEMTIVIGRNDNIKILLRKVTG